MPNVKMTHHLYRFFPNLENQKITVPAGSVAEILYAVNEIAPGFTDYVLDEHGALRRHVNLSINNAMVIDKKNTLGPSPRGWDCLYFPSAKWGLDTQKLCNDWCRMSRLMQNDTLIYKDFCNY
jgi:hypothetical protein